MIKSSREFTDICKREVRHYLHDIWGNEKKDCDVYVVWLCKTLQNQKALLSTDIPDQVYYEFTYNGDKNELYMDVYGKLINKCIEIGD